MRIKDAEILRARLEKSLATLKGKDGRDDSALAQCVQVIINAIDDLPVRDVVDVKVLQRLEDENKQLREQIMLMRIQMRGDCGTCKNKRMRGWVCYECTKTSERVKWEYEGLPVLPGEKMDGNGVAG